MSVIVRKGSIGESRTGVIHNLMGIEICHAPETIHNLI